MSLAVESFLSLCASELEEDGGLPIDNAVLVRGWLLAKRQHLSDVAQLAAFFADAPRYNELAELRLGVTKAMALVTSRILSKVVMVAEVVLPSRAQ